MGKTIMVSENKWLAMALALMCVVIAVLAGFVFVGINRGGEEVAVNEDSGEVEAPTAERIEYMKFEEKFNATQIEAQKLMDGGQVEAAMALYDEAKKEYEQAGEYSRVQEYILAEYNILMAAGLKQEALDALVSNNYEIFPANIQHRRYKQIISLAQELGRADIVAQYEPLEEETRAAFESSNAAIKRTLAEQRSKRTQEESE